MKLYSRDRARRSLFDTIGFRAVSQLATVLSYPVLVRGMTEQSFGILNLLYAVIPLVSTLGSLGLDSTLKRFQPELLRRGEHSFSAWLVRSVRITRLASNLLIIAVLLAGWHWIAPLFGLADYRGEFAIFAVLIVCYFQVNILQLSLASQMLHRYSVGSVAILSLVKLAAYVALWATESLTLTHAIVSDVAAYGFAYAFLATQHRRLRKAAGVGAARPPPEQLSRLKRFAGYTYLNDAASPLTYTETDRLFVAALLNPLAVGAYAFYTRLNEMASNLTPLRLFENIVNPLLFGIPQDQAKEKLPRYFTLLVNINWIYQLPVIVFCWVFHREIVALAFGGKFIEHSMLLPIVITFGASDNVISLPVTMLAQYREKAHLIFVSQLWGIYQIGAMLLLVPLIGLIGAAMATGTFHLFRNLFVWWCLREFAVWTNAARFLGATLMIWGIAAALCEFARRAAGDSALLHLILGAAICGVAVLAHIRSPALSNPDRQIIANLLHGREGRLLKWLGIAPAQHAA